ncbi:uncharacterized protein PV06_08551 [Exophiala oligosperma]|uniref:Uncharacterized protein n=1 Tax=Exophiala oligosperma TaxID=215243 RepID=A0A0D2DWZ3_9EURO|nr:uncharacterized protein PV06_08551 [Exophiala oligosperma]KIW39994.1 hypothetical protein PV06_08551 [Exophiala oligosperma]
MYGAPQGVRERVSHRSIPGGVKLCAVPTVTKYVLPSVPVNLITLLLHRRYSVILAASKLPKYHREITISVSLTEDIMTLSCRFTRSICTICTASVISLTLSNQQTFAQHFFYSPSASSWVGD